MAGNIGQGLPSTRNKKRSPPHNATNTSSVMGIMWKKTVEQQYNEM
jgi:hypothetical protein